VTFDSFAVLRYSVSHVLVTTVEFPDTTMEPTDVVTTEEGTYEMDRNRWHIGSYHSL
jgi:hypothetical protein